MLRVPCNICGIEFSRTPSRRATSPEVQPIWRISSAIRSPVIGVAIKTVRPAAAACLTDY